MVEAKIRRTEIPMPDKLKISKELGYTEFLNLNKKTLKCVDPRKLQAYSPEDNAKSIINEHRNKMPENYENSVAIPGGSLGYAMIVMGAFTNFETGKTDITAQQAVDFVLKWHEKEGIQFSYHTDNCGHGFGCGHVRLASQKENEEFYKIKSDDVKTILDYTDEKVNRGRVEAVETVLTGHHGEKGVVLNKGDKTVKQKDDRGNELFRFDIGQHEKNLVSLASFIIENANDVIGRKIDISEEKLIEKVNVASNIQANATLGLLAASLGRELPVFEIDSMKEKPEFKEIGKVLPLIHKKKHN